MISAHLEQLCQLVKMRGKSAVLFNLHLLGQWMLLQPPNIPSRAWLWQQKKRQKNKVETIVLWAAKPLFPTAFMFATASCRPISPNKQVFLKKTSCCSGKR